MERPWGSRRGRGRRHGRPGERGRSQRRRRWWWWWSQRRRRCHGTAAAVWYGRTEVAGALPCGGATEHGRLGTSGAGDTPMHWSGALRLSRPARVAWSASASSPARLVCAERLLVTECLNATRASVSPLCYIQCARPWVTAYPLVPPPQSQPPAAPHTQLASLGSGDAPRHLAAPHARHAVTALTPLSDDPHIHSALLTTLRPSLSSPRQQNATLLNSTPSPLLSALTGA